MANLFKKSIQIGCVTGLLLFGSMGNANAIEKKIDDINKYALDACRYLTIVSTSADKIAKNFSGIYDIKPYGDHKIKVSLKNTELEYAPGEWITVTIICDFTLEGDFLSYKLNPINTSVYQETYSKKQLKLLSDKIKELHFSTK